VAKGRRAERRATGVAKGRREEGRATGVAKGDFAHPTLLAQHNDIEWGEQNAKKCQKICIYSKNVVILQRFRNKTCI